MREYGFRVDRPLSVAVRKLGTACFFLGQPVFILEMSWKSNLMERKLYFESTLSYSASRFPPGPRIDTLSLFVCCENWLANGPPAIFILDRPLGTSSRSERLR